MFTCRTPCSDSNFHSPTGECISGAWRLRRAKAARKKQLLADAREQTPAGANPKVIWDAAWSANIEVFNMLLEAGANPTMRKCGTPLLHRATYWGGDEIVRRLVELGVDPNLKDARGKTAIEFARGSSRAGNAPAVLRLAKRNAKKSGERVQPAKEVADPVGGKQLRVQWKRIRPGIRKDPLFSGGALADVDRFLRNQPTLGSGARSLGRVGPLGKFPLI